RRDLFDAAARDRDALDRVAVAVDEPARAEADGGREEELAGGDREVRKLLLVAPPYPDPVVLVAEPHDLGAPVVGARDGDRRARRIEPAVRDRVLRGGLERGEDLAAERTEPLLDGRGVGRPLRLALHEQPVSVGPAQR